MRAVTEYAVGSSSCGSFLSPSTFFCHFAILSDTGLLAGSTDSLSRGFDLVSELHIFSPTNLVDGDGATAALLADENFCGRIDCFGVCGAGARGNTGFVGV